jgi:hypothetical protein
MINRTAGLLRKHWVNLDEVLGVALRHGFTEDQFSYAIDKVGSDPHYVANELQRHWLMAAIRDTAKAA